MRKLLYIFLATVFVYSCEKENTEDNNDLNKFIQPLGVGYSWTFIDSTFTSEGTFIRVDTSTLSIVGNEIANYDGKEIELFYWKWDFTERIWLKTNEEENSCSYGLRENDESYLIARSLDQKYPVNIGDIWYSYRYDLREDNDIVYGLVTDTVVNECVNKDYTFKTLAGELECMVTTYSEQMRDNFRETCIYHCPGIGYVGLENKQNNIITFKKTLMHYNLTSNPDLSSLIKSRQIENEGKSISDCYGLVFK